MQIYTITCHDVYNYGASLQAYALQTYLRRLGNDVKTIDYKPDYLSQHFKLGKVANPKYDKPFIRCAYLAAKLPERLKILPKKKAFDEFTSEHLSLTKRFESFEELKANPPKADLYIAGSDQIWNPLFQNGKDPAFYLDFVKSGKRASYAASFAVSEFPPELREKTAQMLKKFDKISIREKSGLEILRSMGIENARVVLDPVFLLDKSQWQKLCRKPEGAEKGYVLVYDFDGSDLIKQAAVRLAKENGLKIYSLYDLPYANKSFQNVGPCEFLSLVENADAVISNSFHATAFSIIFSVPFFVVKRNEKINSRMTDLLESLGLSERIIEEVPGSIEFDRNETEKRLESLISDSVEYVKELLKH